MKEEIRRLLPTEKAGELAWIHGPKDVAGLLTPLAGCAADSRPTSSLGRPDRGTGSSLTIWSWDQTANWRCSALTCNRTVRPASLRTNVIRCQVNVHAAISAHMTQIALLISGGKPGIGVHSFWESWEGGQGRTSDTRRDIATGPSLMRTFLVVVLEKCLCDLTHLLQVTWVMNL
jgi:hypothetical protein